MAYTPELSMKSSRTLRRISWALGVPMTKGIEFVFEYLPQILDREKVCQACRWVYQCQRDLREGKFLRSQNRFIYNMI